MRLSPDKTDIASGLFSAARSNVMRSRAALLAPHRGPRRRSRGATSRGAQLSKPCAASKRLQFHRGPRVCHALERVGVPRPASLRPDEQTLSGLFFSARRAPRARTSFVCGPWSGAAAVVRLPLTTTWRRPATLARTTADPVRLRLLGMSRSYQEGATGATPHHFARAARPAASLNSVPRRPIP
jgi:hypothetical protein